MCGPDPVGVTAQRALRPYHDELKIVHGHFHPAPRTRARHPGTVFLIRPDGYIAARGTTERLPQVLDYLRQLFASPDERCQTSPPRGFENAQLTHKVATLLDTYYTNLPATYDLRRRHVWICEDAAWPLA